MGRWVLVLFTCASCAKLLGLNEIGVPKDGADPNLDTGGVTGNFTQRWYTLEADGTAMQQSRPYPADKLSGSVTLADGSKRELKITDGGFTFTTPSPGDAYSLHLVGQTGQQTWNLSATGLNLYERLTYPPDRVLADAGTMLVLNVPNAARVAGTNIKEELVTLGTFTRHEVMFPDAIAVDCASTDVYGVQIGLLTPHDSAYYTSTSLDSTNTYFRIAHSAKVSDVITVDGMSTTLPMSPLTVDTLPLDQCARILAHGGEETTREEALVPNAVAAASQHAWYVQADPAFEFSEDAALPLAFGNTDGSTVDAKYSNPYQLTSLDAVLYTFALNGDGAGLSSKVVVPAAAACGPTVEIKAGLVELPTNVALGGTALVTTSQLVPVPGTGRISITWDTSSDGHADFYVVLVDQIVDQNHVVSVEHVTTRDHSVSIPVSDFVATDTYQISVFTESGFPMASTGDFTTSLTQLGAAKYQAPPFRVTSQ